MIRLNGTNGVNYVDPAHIAFVWPNSQAMGEPDAPVNGCSIQTADGFYRSLKESPENVAALRAAWQMRSTIAADLYERGDLIVSVGLDDGRFSFEFIPNSWEE